MKKKFTKILGVGLTLALLCSLLLTAAPVSAISTPSVTVAPTTISAVDAEYAIRFELDEQLTGGTTVVATGGNYDLAGIGDSFVITSTGAGTATITPDGAGGTVTVTMSTGGTWSAPTATFTAAGQTATVTVLTVNATTGKCFGTWAQGTDPATAAVGIGDADTITIVFESDTAVVIDPTATILAGPGWINGIWLGATTTTVTEVGTVDTRTVVLTLAATTRIGEGAEVRLSFTAGLTNPSSSGNYTLTVATSKETTAVTSAAYTITVPTIAGLPGVASVYNPAGILMAQKNDLSEAVAAAGVDYTIYVGPGTYNASIIDISYAGLTFVSTDGAATTIIDATGLTGPVITISAADVTVEGFTIKPGINDATDKGVLVAGADATVKDNIITSVVSTSYPEGINIATAGTGATVSGNELSLNNTMMVIGATGATLSDNTFGAGINVQGSTDITITGNTLIGVELWGIVFESSASSDILIEDNTISGTTLGDATGIYFRDNLTHVGIQIVGNDITDNEGDGIGIPSGNTLTDSVIKFNTITGNDTTTGDYGIDNDSVTAVDATFNWWGTTVAADIADMVSGTTVGIVDYEPFLTGAAGAVLSASEVVANATGLDASTTVGVKVEGATAATIVAAKYVANPQEAKAGAIAFYDVYVAGTGTTDVTIKFYAGDANTDVYLWSAGTLTWGDPLTAVFSVYGGYVWVEVDPAMLAGTPFALVGGAVDAPLAPEILAPVTGDDTVSLTPIFAWEAATNADGYNFQLADNANFVTPMVKLDGDLGRLVVTAYAYVGELPYSTAYYWRVQAVSGTVAAGTLAASAWSTGVFITMDEPAEELPPVVVQEQPPVIIEPIVEVITPAATEITPSWIYVIIGVGAVLVIALLVLIVRTRRVA